ncbi:3-beta hydroxysteroid dehydrogenase [Clavibacter nebraskensis]|uniref:3-beta hydroxysteroid dehydrogenase n=1 Tax=Clavibacter nebraskensis TaxID=31963 RepID=UPI003F86FD6B
MQVAVVGGGISGAAIARAVEERGGEARLLSRSTGFDVLRDDARAAIAGADAVVEATGLFTTSARRATRFFTGSTRAVGGAARETGARHVLLSIVGCTLPEVQGYGYFAGKTAQEEAARTTGAELMIVRSTQWFEFARQNLARMRFGPIALVPGMRIQPVALDAVAAVVADVATGIRPGPVVEVAGPDVMTLWEMTRALDERGARPVPLPIPGRLGRAFGGGALLPGPGVEVVGPRFADRATG